MTSATDELAKLTAYLRRQGEQCNAQQPFVRIAGSELLKAADRLQSLEAENARLREDWTEDEQAAVAQLASELGMEQQAVLRCALRQYQAHYHRLKAGEICRWTGDHQRAVDFAGPLASPNDQVTQAVLDMPLPDDPHTDPWILGFCRARKMAAEIVRSFLVQPLKDESGNSTARAALEGKTDAEEAGK